MESYKSQILRVTMRMLQNSDSDDGLYILWQESIDDFVADDEWHESPRELDQDPVIQADQPIRRAPDDRGLEAMLNPNLFDLSTRIK